MTRKYGRLSGSIVQEGVASERVGCIRRASVIDFASRGAWMATSANIDLIP